MHQKLAPDPFLILLNNPKQPLHARNSFKNKIFLKEDYPKGLKKLTLFSLSNPVPFNGKSYQKQKECGTSDQSLFVLWNKFKNILLFVTYFLTKSDDLFLAVFELFQKLPLQIYEVNSWHYKLFHFHLTFTKIWISRE